MSRAAARSPPAGGASGEERRSLGRSSLRPRPWSSSRREDDRGPAADRRVAAVGEAVGRLPRGTEHRSRPPGTTPSRQNSVAGGLGDRAATKPSGTGASPLRPRSRRGGERDDPLEPAGPSPPSGGVDPAQPRTKTTVIRGARPAGSVKSNAWASAGTVGRSRRRTLRRARAQPSRRRRRARRAGPVRDGPSSVAGSPERSSAARRVQARGLVLCRRASDAQVGLGRSRPRHPVAPRTRNAWSSDASAAASARSDSSSLPLLSSSARPRTRLRVSLLVEVVDPVRRAGRSDLARVVLGQVGATRPCSRLHLGKRGERPARRQGLLPTSSATAKASLR